MLPSSNVLAELLEYCQAHGQMLVWHSHFLAADADLVPAAGEHVPWSSGPFARLAGADIVRTLQVFLC